MFLEKFLLKEKIQRKFEVIAREYVGTLAREHESTQGTLACKHAKHVGT